MAASSSSSPSSSSLWKYDVFLSFYGEDTRRSFVCHLYRELKSRHINTFKDDEELERGTYINGELIGAIKGSKFAVAIISENYAASRWCLQELAEIMDCRRKGSTTVIPIFYDVNPSDVRNLRGQFAKAFKEHEMKCPEDVGRWKGALSQAANIVGGDRNNRDYKDDVELIQKISQDILNRLNWKLPNDNPNLKGMDVHMKAIEPLLELGSKGTDVHVIGLCGMGGIGKTTIGKYICGKFHDQFDLSCFYHVKKDNRHDEASLQRDFLSEVIQVRDVTLPSFAEGSKVLRARLGHKKVLIVLDNVEEWYQIQALAGDIKWFGPGSRIILTSRDKGLLSKFANENKIHDVECLYKDDAMKLFCQYAFEQEFPKDGFSELSNRFIKYAHGLPLALKVLGSLMWRESKEEWEVAQHHIEENPPKHIIDVLKISYDSLDNKSQDIFLYLACWFRWETVEDATRILNRIYLDAKNCIKVLMNKSLVDVVEKKSYVRGKRHIDRRFNMHDLLQQMGREVNRQLSIDNPGKRKFLMDSIETNDVLKDAMGTEKVQAISLNANVGDEDDDILLTDRALEGMVNLRIFEAKFNLVGEDGLSHLPRKLVLLRWDCYPLNTMPSRFYPEYLVQLQMSGSNLKSLWKGTRPLKNLKIMDLSESPNLKTIASISKAQNLEKLDLSACDSLVDVSALSGLTELVDLDLSFCESLADVSSIRNLPKLASLNLTYCENLEYIPSFHNMKSLECLYLGECCSLKSVPKVSPGIEQLTLYGTPVRELPVFIIKHPLGLVEWDTSNNKFQSIPREDIDRWENVETLAELRFQGYNILVAISCILSLQKLDCKDLKACTKLKCFPSDLGFQDLDVSDCSNVEMIPAGCPSIEALYLTDWALIEVWPLIGQFSGLVELDASGAYIESIPRDVDNMSSLKILRLNDCRRLTDIPETIQNMKSLEILELDRCEYLKSLPELPKTLRRLSAAGCVRLTKINSQLFMSEIWHLNLAGCYKLAAIASFELEAKGNPCFACLPGNRIPGWFTSQAIGCSVSISVPHDRLVVGFFGFVVVSNRRGTTVQCRCCLRREGGTEDLLNPHFPDALRSSRTFPDDQHNPFMPDHIRSSRMFPEDHLCIFSHYFEKPEKCTGLVLDFSAKGLLWDSPERIKQCGVCPIFIEDPEKGESSGFTASSSSFHIPTELGNKLIIEKQSTENLETPQHNIALGSLPFYNFMEEKQASMLIKESAGGISEVEVMICLYHQALLTVLWSQKRN